MLFFLSMIPGRFKMLLLQSDYPDPADGLCPDSF